MSEPEADANSVETPAETRSDSKPAPTEANTQQDVGAEPDLMSNGHTEEPKADTNSATEPQSQEAPNAPSSKQDGEGVDKSEEEPPRKRRKSGWTTSGHRINPRVKAVSLAEAMAAKKPKSILPAPTVPLLPGQSEKERIMAQAKLQLAQLMATQKLNPAPVLGNTGLPSSDALSRRVYVGSLPYELNEEHVRMPFQRFGQILKIDMPREPTGKSKGFCFVEYTTQEAAHQAMASMNGFMLGGRSIKVGKPTGAGSGPSPSPMFNPMAMRGMPMGMPMGMGMPMNVGVPLPAVGAPALPKKNCRIYVGSITYELQAEQVKAVFTAFGTIKSCELIPNTETGGHKGYGFIEFEDEKSAADAVAAMDGFDLCGRNLKVGWANSTGGGPNSNPSSSPMMGTVHVEQSLRQQDDPQISARERVRIMEKLAASAQESRCIVLTNMVDANDIDDDLPGEVKEEAERHGNVEKVKIHVRDDQSVLIFVVYDNKPDAVKARLSFDRRYFAGRVVAAKFYDEAKFNTGDYDTGVTSK